jgi:hypothetical protein
MSFLRLDVLGVIRSCASPRMMVGYGGLSGNMDVFRERLGCINHRQSWLDLDIVVVFVSLYALRCLICGERDHIRVKEDLDSFWDGNCFKRVERSNFPRHYVVEVTQVSYIPFPYLVYLYLENHGHVQIPLINDGF